MQLQHFGVAALAFSSTASAYVVTVYENTNCGGRTQSVNVWDNTCAAWMMSFRSVMVTTYGAGQQRAYFCDDKICGTGCDNWWAGGSDTFVKGRCVNLRRQMFSAASYRGLPRLAEGGEFIEVDDEAEDLEVEATEE